MTVPTLDGDVELEFDAGTQPGEVRVLRGRAACPCSRAAAAATTACSSTWRSRAACSDEQRRLLEEFEREADEETYRPGRGVLRQAEERVPLNLLRVSVTVPLAEAERARAIMLELFPEGFEESDGADGVELAAYTDAAGEERLWSAFGGARSTDVEEGWEDRWRAFHRPVRIGPLWVGPPWEEPDAGRDRGRDRPGPRLRHRCARDDAALPRAAARRAAREPARRRLRLRRALDRRREARLRAGARGRPRPAGDRGDARATPARTASRSTRRLADALADALPASDVAVANVALERRPRRSPDGSTAPA